MNKRTIKHAENGIQVYVIEHKDMVMNGMEVHSQKIEKVFYSVEKANQYIRKIKG